MSHRRSIASVAALLLLAGCPAPVAPTGSAKPSARPAADAKPLSADAKAAIAKALAGQPTLKVAQGVAVSLAGQVRLLPAGVGIVSDNGGGVISNNGGGILSNNGAGLTTAGSNGTLISDKGGGVLANNGAKRRLSQAAPAEYALADAAITFHDARGRALLGPDDAPLAAFTDRSGAYRFDGTLPAGNVVMRIKLFNGATLQAMLPQGTRAQDVDTASSLGAAYVLGRYVATQPEPQATFDKLPAAEADRLQRALAGALAQLPQAPAYDPAALDRAAADLATRAPGVAASFETIQALLIGQDAGGVGRKATDVALTAPAGLWVDRAGNLLIAEPSLARVRTVAPDGTFGSLIDPVRGSRSTASLAGLDQVLEAPDGSLVVHARYAAHRIGKDGQATLIAGAINPPRLTAPATRAADARVSRVAVAPDGAVWFAEGSGPIGTLPRIARVTAGGGLAPWPGGIPDARPGDGVNDLAFGTDGTLWVLMREGDGFAARLYRAPAGGPLAPVQGVALGVGSARLATAADGGVWISEDGPRRVRRLAPDGTFSGPPAEGGPQAVGELAVGGDGRVYVTDWVGGAVWSWTEAGGWRRDAGAGARVDQAGGLASAAVNTPYGVAFRSDGSLLISEPGLAAIRQIAGTSLTVFAGGKPGPENGPALEAWLPGPWAIAAAPDALWFSQRGGQRLRKIDLADPAHPVTTAAGGAGMADGRPAAVAPGARIPAAAYRGFEIAAIAVGPDGRPWFSSGNQILRLAADDRVELVAGKPHDFGEDETAISAMFTGGGGPDGTKATEALLNTPTGLAFDRAGDLYFADPGHLRVAVIRQPGTPAATIETFAGLGPVGSIPRLATGEVDAAAVDRRAALLVLPTSLAFDAQGGLYVGELGLVHVAQFAPKVAALLAGMTDLPPLLARVRRIAPDGQVAIVAGPGGRWFPDPTAPDGLLLPTGLAVDAAGRLAIADAGAGLVRILPAP